MNKYESVIIINDTLLNDQKEFIMNKIRDFISRCGTVISSENYGTKTLAYEIKKQKKGYYFQIVFKTRRENIYDLENLYRNTDGILKFIVFKLEE